MKIRGVLFIFVVLFSLVLTSAGMGYGNNNLPNLKNTVVTTSITFNNNTGNVNNSIYWDSHSWHNMSTPFFNWVGSFLYNYNQSTPYDTYNYNMSTPFFTWLAGFVYNYNQTVPAITYTDNYISAMNSTWTSTFNATYDAKNSSQWVTTAGDIYYQNLTGKVGIGTTTPSALLNVVGYSGTLVNITGNTTDTIVQIYGKIDQRGINGATDGASGSTNTFRTGAGAPSTSTTGGNGGTISLTLGAGAITTGNNVNGGSGGSFSFTAGTGGQCNTTSTSTSFAGGAGGGATFQMGNGAEGWNQGTGRANGGAGGGLTINFGNGGQAYSGGTNNAKGGTPSSLLMQQGTGGSATTATTGTNEGGNGVSYQFTSGNGGTATKAQNSIGGNGGGVIFISGTGGVAQGNASLAGTKALGGTGGTFDFTGGNGASSTTAILGTNTGGNGSSLTFTGGTGGSATNGRTNNWGGAGGSVTFSSGAGGAGNTSTWNYSGSIIFNKASTTMMRLNFTHPTGQADELQLSLNTTPTTNGIYDIGNNATRFFKGWFKWIDLSSGLSLWDNAKAYFGTSSQSSIYYNGSDMLINPKDVGAGVEYHLGNQVAKNISSTEHTPITDAVYSLGSSTLRWLNGWFNNLDVSGNLNQTGGNATINMVYGEMFNKSDDGFETVDLVGPDVYVRVGVNFTGGNLNGFTYADGNLTAQIAGMYQVIAKVGAVATATAGEYGMEVFVNDVGQTDCYDHEEPSLAPIGFIATCIIPLNVGDRINIRFDDHADPVRDLTLINGNVNLFRIGT